MIAAPETATEPRQRGANPGPHWLRNRILVSALLAAALVVTAILVVPGVYASRDVSVAYFPEAQSLGLGARHAPKGTVASPELYRNKLGYALPAGRSGAVSVPVDLPKPHGNRVLLRVWAYGQDPVQTKVTLVSHGSQRSLGQAQSWVGKPFDVTDEAAHGPARVRVTSSNPTSRAVLFLDRIAAVPVPNGVGATASPWSVALLVLLTVLTALTLTARLRRHWILAVLMATAAGVLWISNPAANLELPSLAVANTWDAARSASWLGFHDGLLWGSWAPQSSLTVQVFHALTPLVGKAQVSAHSAGIFASVLALAAVYAVGHRAAGRGGAVVATILAFATEAFRHQATAGTDLPVLVLAGALFVYAVHACLAETTRTAILLLAGGTTLLALAEPAWLLGALVAMVFVAFVYGTEGQRLRVLGTGLLVSLLLLAPHLASTASQNDGSLFADMSGRAIVARNAEFAGHGHGSPTRRQLARDPLAGRPVTLFGYILGDHSLSQVVGSTLSGGQQGLSAFSARDGLGLISVLAFTVLALGGLYVLILPRLRALVLLACLVVVPTLFIAGRTDADAFSASAVVWSALLASAAILAYAVANLSRPFVAARLPMLRAPNVRLPRFPPRGRKRSPAGLAEAPARASGPPLSTPDGQDMEAAASGRPTEADR